MKDKNAMLPDLNRKLQGYVDQFNRSDEENVAQAIDNAHAYDFLSTQIPLLECPDEDIERAYYFRWWTYRKHFKSTEHGHIVTEFLPPVPWAGPHNSINCAAGLHIREGRWLSDPQGWLKEYILFWLHGHGDAFAYSSWLAFAVEEYCLIRGDDGFGIECLDRLVDLYHRWEQKALHPCGLFWANDDRDGMEFSISGPGLRPTINAYMYGNAMAISRIARKAKNQAWAAMFEKKAAALSTLMQSMLWDHDFYKTIPCERNANIAPGVRPVVKAAHDVRELIGFIPWYFNMPDAGTDKAFAWLKDEQKGFFATFGLTTAEQQHPRFMFSNVHECLWNGPVWPFATSQTLVALANALHSRPQTEVTNDDYYRLLRQYALSHRRMDEQGRDKPWIDENMHPYTGRWLARDTLESWRWLAAKGGYERGKDYNHSLFCDLVLSGLLGIAVDGNGLLIANPLIPGHWDHFCVTNVTHRNKRHTILYDRTGKRYQSGCGLQIRCDD